MNAAGGLRGALASKYGKVALAIAIVMALAGLGYKGAELTAAGTTHLSALSVSGPISVGTFIDETAGSTITVTPDSTISIASSYQPLTAADAVGTANLITTTVSAGYVTTLINVGSNTITITDTGTTMLAGNAALGQYDTLTVMFDGTNWIELARANN